MSEWQPIETAPTGQLVIVYSPPTIHDWPDSIRIDFDFIDPEDGETWVHHSEHYEHFCVVACDGMTGPSEKAPYTHWIPLPKPPEAKP